jgi:hypothetical protein
VPGDEVEVELELPAAVAVPAIIPLNWDFIVRRLASFGGSFGISRNSDGTGNVTVALLCFPYSHPVY